MQTETNIKNHLWQARRRSRLERKQVAFLLARKSTDEISRYEKGSYLPSLKTALKLEVIYRMPLRFLFQTHYEQYQSEISELRKQHVNLFPDGNWFPKPAEQLRQEEFCFYAQLLKSHVPSSLELESVTKHVIALSNTISDFKQGRDPFSNN